MRHYLCLFIGLLGISTIVFVYILSRTQKLNLAVFHSVRRRYKSITNTITTVTSEGSFVGQVSWQNGEHGRDKLTQLNSTQPPHVVFIFADDLGFFDVGYHGSEIQTPAIDLMAKQGVRLENYYSQATCTPSRAVLMTGKYMNHNAMGHVLDHDEDLCLPLHHELLPQRLQKCGYMTHMVGKWHLGRGRWECLPNRRGFHSFLGIHHGSSEYFKHGNRLYINEDAAPGTFEGIYSPYIYTNRSVDLIRNHSITQKGKPLFLYLATQLPHTPSQVPKPFLEDYKNITDRVRRVHAAMVAALDGLVREVVGALKKYGLWHNTVLIFSSDNGGTAKHGGFNWPLKGRKSSYFEGSIRVAGLVNSPLLSDEVRGTTFTGLMGLADWLPTIVEGIAGENTLGISGDGYNMWPSLRFGVPSPRSDYLFSLGAECNASNRDSWMDKRARFDGIDRKTCYRWKNWKFVFDRNGTESMHLYDISKDPYERKDLVNENPGMVEIIRNRMREKFCPSAIPLLAKHVGKCVGDLVVMQRNGMAPV